MEANEIIVKCLRATIRKNFDTPFWSIGTGLKFI